MFDKTFSRREELRFKYNLHDGKRRIVVKLLPFLLNKTVLDFGCGNGHYTKLISATAKKVYGYDFDVENAKRMNPEYNIEYTTELPSQCDVAICNDSLEFNENWREILQDLKTRARVVYIIAPNFNTRKTPWLLLKLSGLHNRLSGKQKAQKEIDKLEVVESGHDKYVDDFYPAYKRAEYFFLQSNPFLSLLENTSYCNHALYEI